MAQLIFTQQLARFFAVPQVDSTALVLRAALEQAFASRACVVMCSTSRAICAPMW